MGQNQGKGKNKLAYAPKPKIPLPPKREDPAKDSICHEYGETIHWKRKCPQYLSELLKKKLSLGASNSGIFTIELNTFLNRSWIYDTGCGTHICNTTHGLRASRKLKPGALSFAIPRDGIFEIDLSNSYANVSSMYVVSNKRAKLDLDSALLWHCRLGHISKKRIEKLQHDELLNSTDLRALEKCVSYTHPSIDTSLHHEEDDLEIDEPQSDIIPIRRSTRTRHALNRMCLYVDAEEHELGDLGELVNYKVALLDFEITLQLCFFNGSKPKNNDELQPRLSNFFKNFDSNGGDDLCYQDTAITKAGTKLLLHRAYFSCSCDTLGISTLKASAADT
ncbi:zinc finger, CCHC-type containing protein [Tanacetum coccineum]